MYALIFLFLLRNIDCGYSLEPPRRGGSNEYPQSMFWAEIWKISEFFIWKFSLFLAVKVSIYSKRRVYVMWAHTDKFLSGYEPSPQYEVNIWR